MIPIQLPTGKTIFLTFEEWLNMTDEALQNIIADDIGMNIDDPFDKKIDKVKSYKDILDEFDIPEIPDKEEEND